MEAQLEGTRRIAKNYSLDARVVEVKTLEEVEPALARFVAERVQGLIVTVGPLLLAKRAYIAQTALRRKWPMIAFSSLFADEGALMTYGPNFADQFRCAA